jgi:hypothetical protein
MRNTKLMTTVLFAALAAACTGSVVGNDPTSPKTPASSTLEYVGKCTPALCADLGVPAIACAEPETTTTICEPGSGGTCVIDIECGSPPSSPPLCNPAACGPAAPAIAPVCPTGSTIVTDCVKTGSTCEWEPMCVAPSGPDCNPSSCGAEPAIAPICPDGQTGSLVCSGTSSGECGWTVSCPGEEVDGGAPGNPGPPTDEDSGVSGSEPSGDAGAFDAAAWADAKGL